MTACRACLGWSCVQTIHASRARLRLSHKEDFADETRASNRKGWRCGTLCRREKTEGRGRKGIQPGNSWTRCPPLCVAREASHFTLN